MSTFRTQLLHKVRYSILNNIFFRSNFAVMTSMKLKSIQKSMFVQQLGEEPHVWCDTVGVRRWYDDQYILILHYYYLLALITP